MKFLPNKSHELQIGDVVRFGRIPFKITKMVLDLKKEKEMAKNEKDSIKKAITSIGGGESSLKIVDDNDAN